MTAREEALARPTAGRRECPVPDASNQLYQLLPGTRRPGAGGERPSPPSILSAWHFSEDWQKASRLREQLAWAADYGALPRVDAFLAALPDEAGRVAS